MCRNKNSIKTSNGDTWSRGTNSRLPFDINVMLNLSRVTFTVNCKGQIQDKNSQNRKLSEKTVQNNSYG